MREIHLHIVASREGKGIFVCPYCGKVHRMNLRKTHRNGTTVNLKSLIHSHFCPPKGERIRVELHHKTPLTIVLYED